MFVPAEFLLNDKYIINLLFPLVHVKITFLTKIVEQNNCPILANSCISRSLSLTLIYYFSNCLSLSDSLSVTLPLTFSLCLCLSIFFSDYIPHSYSFFLSQIHSIFFGSNKNVNFVVPVYFPSSAYCHNVYI